jgi:RNA polymerase-binding transcription factor DksA
VLSVATHSIPGDFENEAENDEHDGDGTPTRPNVLASSSQVTERLIGPDPQALLHISLPRWSWTFKRRQQWQAALEHWSQIDNLVILVELPPVSVSESLLLAETVPNLFWLVDAGATTAAELREHLDQFRQARCNLVGVGLNHESPETGNSDPDLVRRSVSEGPRNRRLMEREMRNSKVAQYQAQLKALADRMRLNVEEIEEQVRMPTGGQDDGSLSSTPLHLGDLGTEAFIQELNATLLENEEYIREEVVAALARIDEGTFGVCERCGGQIMAQRLEVLPYTRYCTKCAAQLGTGQVGTGVDR